MINAAIYAGSMDPMTLGHLWMIEQGSSLFDHLQVAVGVNPNKQSTFSLQERLDMICESTSHISNMSVAHFENKFLIHYAKFMGVKFIIRGIRNSEDYEYERGMWNINRDIDLNITTVFLMPPRDIAEVSSSMVKSMVGPAGWEDIVSKYVPTGVLERLKIKYEIQSR